jgi:hypothetical protein
MLQYEIGNKYLLKDKNGNNVKTTGFRSRRVFPENFIYIQKANQIDELRPDVRALETYDSFKGLYLIIDANNKDIFSFNMRDNINYPDIEFLEG